MIMRVVEFLRRLGLRNKGIDWDTEELLGKIPDRQLAALRGVHRKTISMARECRGIPVYSSSEDIEVVPSSSFEIAPDTVRSCDPEVVATVSVTGIVPTSKRQKSFDVWIQEQQRDPKRPWNEWPSQAISEIAEVLRRNDVSAKGHRFIPVRAMVARLRDAWGVEIDESMMHAYCRVELGRSGGWKHA